MSPMRCECCGRFLGKDWRITTDDYTLCVRCYRELAREQGRKA